MFDESYTIKILMMFFLKQFLMKNDAKKNTLN